MKFIILPKIERKSICHAVVEFPRLFQSLDMKLKTNGEFLWFGFDGCAEYYKEREQRKNRQLLPGTCIGEIK